ncbi:hypothetical protein CYMTET_24295 [Cymbomonas tetramitiformis]|uniref:Uncharacterized protein n=1 Tax=Cymbomonas tetramitiformis TaxID=36881 RepID=A0AAE0FW29_9CHLO|nr:hypothetical protein CYMTET_24295 [Cymbomonas tetramitiformis]
MFAAGGGAMSLFGLRGGQRMDELREKEFQVALALRDEVALQAHAMYTLAARWDGGEPEEGDESSSSEGEEEGLGLDDDADAQADAVARAKGMSSKRQRNRFFGMTKVHGFIGLILFIMLAELLMFLDSANFWSSVHKGIRHGN